MELLRRAFCWAFLVALLSLCQLLNAADLRQQHDPQGPLGVRLDYELASRSTKDSEKVHQWVFSTHLTFNNDVAGVTNAQLRKIAEDAYEEMVVDFIQYSPKMEKKIPGKPILLPAVITILAFGNEIILSSSQKGYGAFINEVAESPVKEKLELCMAVWGEFNINPDKPDHKNQRRCGEMMAFHQYYQTHREELSHWDPKPRATTVHKNWKEDEIRIIPPCGTDDDYKSKWGCNFFLAGADSPGFIVDYLEEDTELQDYNLDNLAGGIDSITQIRSCGARVD